MGEYENGIWTEAVSVRYRLTPHHTQSPIETMLGMLVFVFDLSLEFNTQISLATTVDRHRIEAIRPSALNLPPQAHGKRKTSQERMLRAMYEIQSNMAQGKPMLTICNSSCTEVSTGASSP